MKNNKDILANRFEPNGFSIQRALGLADDHSLIADPAYKRILFAMEEAQNEILLRFVENVESYPNHESPYPFRFQMSSEKTKRELKECKEYSWFEFMGRRHKGV